MKQGRAAALRRPVALSIGAALAVLALWLWLRDDDTRKNARARGARDAAARVQDERPPVEPAQRLERAPPSRPAASAPEPVAEEHHHPGDPSHPITPEHLRLYRESAMMFDVDNAIQARDFEAIRRLNYAYKQEFPGDKYNVQEAYEIIADCLEKKTPERVARARAFWEVRRSSRARRDMRKICLE